MNKNSRIALIFLSVTSAILLSTTIAFYIIKENEIEKRNAIQKSLDETILAKEAVENRVREIEILNTELKTNVKAAEDKIAMLSSAIEEAKALNNSSLVKIKERESELEKLKSRLEEERSEKEDLIKRLEKLNEDYLNMKFQLESLLKTKEELEKKAKELTEKEGVSLGTIIIKQPAK